MKKLILTGLLSIPSGVALAHQLPGDEILLLRLAHQVLSPHHAPILALAVVIGMLLGRGFRSRKE